MGGQELVGGGGAAGEQLQVVGAERFVEEFFHGFGRHFGIGVEAVTLFVDGVIALRDAVVAKDKGFGAGGLAATMPKYSSISELWIGEPGKNRARRVM